MLSLIEEIISELADTEKPLGNSRLSDLTSLNSEELADFKKLWRDIDPERRRQVMLRLVELAEENFELDFDSIFKSCLDDPDDEVRSKAIEGLWENEELNLINYLLDLLQNDPSDKVQAAAATALGRFTLLAEQQKLPANYHPKIYQALLGILNDSRKPVEVRRRALEAIAPMDSGEVEQIISTAYRSSQPKLRVSAIYAMGKNCNPQWLPILLREMGNRNAEIRYEVACACGEIGDEEAVDGLVELVDDSDLEVQLAAIRALGKIGNTEAKNCLEQCLDDVSEAIQMAAEDALREIDAGEEPGLFTL